MAGIGLPPRRPMTAEDIRDLKRPRTTASAAPRGATSDRPSMPCCKAAARREFDVVMAWSVDRLGRSLQDLVAFLGELHSLGVDLFLHQQGLDTTTPAGKALFQMMGVFAEFERAMIQERVRAGLRRAKDEGKQLGLPKIAADVEAAVRADLHKKDRPGVRVIAATHGVSVNTVQRIAHAR